MSDLLFVSLESWDEVWRRNQFLVSLWAKRFSSHRVLFVGPPRRLGHEVKPGALLRDEAFSPEGLPNVRVVHPWRVLPERWPQGRVINRRVVRTMVRREAERWGLKSPLLWINPYDAGYLRGRMGERGTVYDITDDWELAESDPTRRARLKAQDRGLCRRSDLTVVCSQALYESRLPVARRLLLLPNGVDAEHYAGLTSLDHLDERAGEPPVFGYTGTLHPWRTDVEAIEKLARAFPQGRILLVGPALFDDESQAKVAALANVEVTGAVSYHELPTRMRPFDVCIVPHRESAFTESLNPIKLWEYLASGKPIASTNVAGFRDYAALSHLGSGADGFVEACRAALREARPQDEAELALARQRRDERQSEASGHSWNARFDALLSELRAARLLPSENA